MLNATTGVNIVLRSIRWHRGDHILYFPNAIYGACYNTLQYIRDRHEDITLVPIEIAFPCSHAEILDVAEKKIVSTKISLQDGQRLHLGLMDAICSMPGCVMPWAELCALYRRHDILSLVDAAHLMGQMPVDLSQSQPDFWVSNVHKWSFATRSVALLYVSKRTLLPNGRLTNTLLAGPKAVRITSSDANEAETPSCRNHHLIETCECSPSAPDAARIERAFPSPNILWLRLISDAQDARYGLCI